VIRSLQSRRLVGWRIWHAKFKLYVPPLDAALLHYLISPPLFSQARRRGRGLLDVAKSLAKQGLTASKTYGVAGKLQSMSDPRAQVAGKILAAIGGRKPRRHHRVVHHRRRVHHHRR